MASGLNSVQFFKVLAPVSPITHAVLGSVEAAEGRTAHNNGWDGANGMASNHVFDVFHNIPPNPFQSLPQAVLSY